MRNTAKRMSVHTLFVASVILSLALPSAGSELSSASEPRPAAAGTTPDEPPHSLPIVDHRLRSYAATVDSNLRDEPQYSTTKIREDRTGVEVYWHGTRSKELQALLRAAPSGFSVTTEETPYLPSELRTEARRLLSDAGVVSAGVPPEADRIIVTVDDLQTSMKSTAVTSKYPIDITPGNVSPANSDRFHDTTGNGGALVSLGSTGISSWCTSGFAITNSSGSDRMLTAAHCGYVGTTVYSWANDIPWGTITDRSEKHDAASIGPKDGGFSNHRWGGGLLEADNLYPVTGVFNPLPGDELCFSGAISGADHCGNIVSYADVWDYPDSNMSGIQGWRTYQTDGLRYVGAGDSGGPVTMHTGIGEEFRMNAAALISGHNSNGAGPCELPNYPPEEIQEYTDQRECSYNHLITSASEGAAEFGRYIKTN